MNSKCRIEVIFVAAVTEKYDVVALLRVAFYRRQGGLRVGVDTGFIPSCGGLFRRKTQALLREGAETQYMYSVIITKTRRREIGSLLGLGRVFAGADEGKVGALGVGQGIGEGGLAVVEYVIVREKEEIEACGLEGRARAERKAKMETLPRIGLAAKGYGPLEVAHEDGRSLELPRRRTEEPRIARLAI